MSEDIVDGELAAKSGAGLSRRQVVKASAWAAPAVVALMASPAHAASGPKTVTVDSIVLTGPNGAWTGADVTLRNNSTSATASGSLVFTSTLAFNVPPAPGTFSEIPAGNTQVVSFTFDLTRPATSTAKGTVTANPTPTTAGFTGTSSAVDLPVLPVTVTLSNSGLSGSGSSSNTTFRVSVMNPAGNPATTVTVPLSLSGTATSISPSPPTLPDYVVTLNGNATTGPSNVATVSGLNGQRTAQLSAGTIVTANAEVGSNAPAPSNITG